MPLTLEQILEAPRISHSSFGFIFSACFKIIETPWRFLIELYTVKMVNARWSIGR